MSRTQPRAPLNSYTDLQLHPSQSQGEERALRWQRYRFVCLSRALASRGYDELAVENKYEVTTIAVRMISSDLTSKPPSLTFRFSPLDTMSS